jgi:hypothetical protein
LKGNVTNKSSYQGKCVLTLNPPLFRLAPMIFGIRIKIDFINRLFSTHWWRYWLIWHDHWRIVNALHQRDDLERLVQWSKRKRLSGVAGYYRRLLLDQEGKLFTKQMHFPSLFACAEWVYSFQIALSPTPRYKSGSAAKYRLRNYQRN